VVTSLYYYLKVVKVMYVDPPKDADVVSVGAFERAAQYLSLAGILALGVFPGPVVRLAEQAFAMLGR
jgi:NADH-quinone oxidoreductase subunit N